MTKDRSAEVFARAVEADQRRAPLRPAEFVTELAVVQRLRSLARPGLDEHARNRLRQHIAVQLGLATESAPTVTVSRRPRQLAQLVLSAALCAMVVLVSAGLFSARSALPGDYLYPVRRGVETVSAELTSDNGTQQLTTANQRLADLRALRAANAEPAQLRDAISDFVTQARNASKTVTRTGTNDAGDSLPALRDWADKSERQLRGVSVPKNVLTTMTSARHVLTRIADRATALRARFGCARITSGGVDDLGQLPATGACRTSSPRAVQVSTLER